MTERMPRILIVAAAVIGAMVLAYFAYDRPGYFASQTYLGGLLFLELMLAAIWMYRRFFFPIVVIAFLLAGVELPMASVWTVARWAVLGLGALVGCILMLKDRRHEFGMFHLVSGFAVLAALVSAAVSRYTVVSSLKVLSLALLFTYAATGARLAVLGRENRFFSGLLVGCEIFVGVLAAFYFVGMEIMGNPNSLGAVMGVVAAPLLLWGTLLEQERSVLRRRWFFFGLSMYLTFASHARAGMLAALISCSLLCLVLRRYSLLAGGIGILAIFIATTAIVRPAAFSRAVSSFTSTVIFKGKDPEKGVLSSRTSPWQDTVDSIHEHFWFGTGFGTSDKGTDATATTGKFSSVSTVSAEHGSSYLAITSWVGMAGVLPFLLLLGILVRKVIRIVIWTFRTGDPTYGAVPLAVVIVACMVHAAFEDWMFAPGYYLCVFFWSLAFIFIDQVSSLSTAQFRRQFAWPTVAIRPQLRSVAPR